MLEITNPKLFDFQCSIQTKEDGTRAALINIMVNPRDVTLNTYRRAPFASFVLTDPDDVYAAEKWKALPDKDVKLASLLTGQNSNYIKLSTFIDQQYHYYENLFLTEQLHTLVFEQVVGSVEGIPRLNLVLIGQPVHGMIHPIGRSVYHKLYNGAIVAATRMFKFEGQHIDEALGTVPIYNRFVYLLVEVKSHFQFTEYFQYGEEDRTYACALRRYTTSCQEHTDIIPIFIQDYPEVEDLFRQPRGNLFNLSDIPKGLTTAKNGETLAVKMAE